MARLFGGLNLDNINKAINTLIKKSDDAPEAYNPDRDLQALREREDVIYAALGRQVYGEGGEDRFPETAAQLSEIEAERAEIFEKVAQIEAEKEAEREAERERLARQMEEQNALETPEDRAEVVCPKCGAVCAEGARFCQECGGRIAEVKPKCAQCGAALKPGVRFCSECGARIENAQPANQPVNKPVAPEDTDTPEEPSEDPYE